LEWLHYGVRYGQSVPNMASVDTVVTQTLYTWTPVRCVLGKTVIIVSSYN